ncbi:uncharacterized protein LOC112526238 [Cynara cardunculus var. scolymus]|uniref:uncharacterized protein LOC112526238 n=1 Tax=Cynara cardunculus var. scolymus TaxID=59895 RepID=UPI000D62BA90|nr:uncharacterized protein LOC112526238 [Cynara cardunculus var. scolymus]
MDGRTQKPRLDPGALLRVSDHFLRRRHFDDCRKYAHQAHQIDPNFPGISEIVAVADVLIASKCRISTGDVPDWYAVMQLDRYSDDSDLIRQRFNHLYGLLDPSNNKFSLAKEAFNIVCDAWYVLSNPLQKLEFDDALKKHLDDFAFWTVCPYCYYLYEYPRVYFEICLRCPNDKCSKAFTCVEIDRPPAEVLMEGKYLCAGFLPVGFQHGSWNPFVPPKKEKVNASDDAGNCVDISDDDDDQVETKSDKSLNVSIEEVHEGAGSVKMDGGMPTMKPAMGRKKSVAKKTKKLTGVGNRVTKEGFVHREETELKVCSTDKDHEGCENDFSFGDLGGPIDPTNGGEVEFYDADGDILVSLQNGM